MYQPFGDPVSDILTTLTNFSKKGKPRKSSKSEDSEDKNSDSGKILEISGVLSLNNTEFPEQGDKDDGEKFKTQDKDRKFATHERKSFPTLPRFKIGSRKKSKNEDDSRRTSMEPYGKEKPRGINESGSSSASEDKNEGNQRESVDTSNELALEILKEINTNNLEIGPSTNFEISNPQPQNADTDDCSKGTVELRHEPDRPIGEKETNRKSRKTRSGNFFDLISESINADEELSSQSPEDTSSITWPTLNQEPLYQLYSLNNSNSDAKNPAVENCKRPRIVDLVSTNRRKYWRDIPEVTEFEYSEKLSQDERNLQEAKFEILTSEASYLKSLKTLEIHYIKNILLLGLRSKHLLSEGDLKILFGNVVEVRKISENFLKDLEDLWQSNIWLRGITDVIRNHSGENFEIYRMYSKKFLDMTQKCNDLMAQKEEFKDLLEKLRQSPPAENLPMTSFFALPIQRIARYHMLVENVLKFMKKESEEFEETFTLWEYLKDLARQCDEEIQKRKRTEEMVRLTRLLEFPPEVESICILKSSRFLNLQNQVRNIVFREKLDRLHISIKKINLHLFLFNDLLVMAKKSSDKLTPEHLIVVDYCPRKLVKIKPMKRLELFGIRELTEAKPVILTLLSNHRNESAETIISFEKTSDREQWLAALESAPSPSPLALRPVSCSQPESFPVSITHDYTASNWGELTVSEGDVIEVKEKKIEVWYLGENAATGAIGWFPEECAGKTTPGIRKQEMKKETQNNGGKYILHLEGFSTPSESSA